MVTCRPFTTRGLGLVACAALALLGPTGAGAQCADELARKVFEAANAYYEAGDYDEALRSFSRSYELCPKAEQLKNIGATHERRGDLPAAIEIYEKYLRSTPEPADKEAIALRVSNLKKRLVPAPSASAAAPDPPADAPSASPAPRPRPRPRASEGPSRTTAVTVLGLGGAVGIGALITGLVAQSRYNQAERTCGKNCGDPEVEGIRQMALLSTVLTGLSVVGVGVGSFLYARSSPEPLRPGRPRVDASVGPGQARLGALWVF